MTKPKNQSTAAQAFDRSTVREVLNSQFQNAFTTATERSTKANENEIALRAALAVMERADKYDHKHENKCPHCRMDLLEDVSELNHLEDCPRVAAIRLVREALGE